MRFAYIIGGWFFLGVGIAGIFLPLLPTTPFLLVSSFFFVRSSPRTHGWLMNHRVFGRYVRDWEEQRGVRPGVKILAFAMMAAVTIASTVFGDLPAWALGVLYVLVATGAAVVWLLPTVRDELVGFAGVRMTTRTIETPSMSTVITSQAFAGLTPPSMGEARVRDRFPSVAANFAIATLGHRLTQTIFLAPVAWVIMAIPFFGKLLPIIGRKYCLTNRRLMICAGWRMKPIAEVPLAQIDEVRIIPDANSNFFRAATLEIVTAGKVAMTLPGMPEPEAFRQTILNTRDAWVPEKVKELPFISANDFK